MQNLVVGPFPTGLRTDVPPFGVDNTTFPVLTNAYQWRDRVKRKRGTSLLNRLTRFFNVLPSYSAVTSINLVAGAANLLTGFGLQANGSIVIGSLVIQMIVSLEVFTDPLSDGVLVGNMGGTGTVNYATGNITISGGGAAAFAITMRYYPGLPVLGLEDLSLTPTSNPGTLAFDSKYAYNIKTSFPFSIYDVSFYKNLVSATYTNYVQKVFWTSTSWNGLDYQQYWSCNYQGAFWVTNGVTVPFNTTNIGMQYNTITGFAIVNAGPFPPIPASANITTGTNHGLVIGDFVFINEVGGITGVNFQTGYVTAVPGANVITVTFPNATLAGVYTVGGIAQYLTSRSDTTKDCIRWYDGDPTDGNVIPTFQTGKGWVNFCPPLSSLNYTIADLPAAQYYLVGAKMILPFKDRLLFFGAVVQTSAAGSQVYLQDTIVYSQNGTPYYTASFTGDKLQVTTTFNPILVPTNQTATPTAYFEDETGFGGFVSAGTDQALTSATSNNDVLLLGFNETKQSKLVYSGNDVIPFYFYEISSEFGTASTFSAINMGNSTISASRKGYVSTSTSDSARIDPPIPDQIFQVKLTENGIERFTAQRDYLNEWIYFTYPSNQTKHKFPTQTLLYNYRDDSWAIFYESYTHYGSFRKSDGLTWATIGSVFPKWSQWNEPWNAGSTTILQPVIIGGNQQGFVMCLDDGTGESNILTIQSFSVNTVTCINHCLNNGDYIIISGAIGDVGAQVNGNIFSVFNVTADTFQLSPSIDPAGTYVGGGLIKRMYKPFIQTKQFPAYWNVGKKTRLGVQRYLLTTTDNGQIQLLIYLSQNSASPYNAGPIIPSIGPQNSSLIYSTILFTCTESCNLGLTPSNTNLQMISEIDSAGTDASSPQDQIWHRVNTSLIGDTVQLGFTLSDEQMRDTEFKSQFSEIELFGFMIQISPSQMLS